MLALNGDRFVHRCRLGRQPGPGSGEWEGGGPRVGAFDQKPSAMSMKHRLHARQASVEQGGCTPRRHGLIPHGAAQGRRENPWAGGLPGNPKKQLSLKDLWLSEPNSYLQGGWQGPAWDSGSSTGALNLLWKGRWQKGSTRANMANGGEPGCW